MGLKPHLATVVLVVSLYSKAKAVGWFWSESTDRSLKYSCMQPSGDLMAVTGCLCLGRHMVGCDELLIRKTSTREPAVSKLS